MNELASFSGLIGDICDTTLDLALWPGVLGSSTRKRASGCGSLRRIFGAPF
jgi:hypothetical protein